MSTGAEPQLNWEFLKAELMRALENQFGKEKAEYYFAALPDLVPTKSLNELMTSAFYELIELAQKERKLNPECDWKDMKNFIVGELDNYDVVLMALSLDGSRESWHDTSVDWLLESIKEELGMSS